MFGHGQGRGDQARPRPMANVGCNSRSSLASVLHGWQRQQRQGPPTFMWYVSKWTYTLSWFKSARKSMAWAAVFSRLVSYLAERKLAWAEQFVLAHLWSDATACGVPGMHPRHGEARRPYVRLAASPPLASGTSACQPLLCISYIMLGRRPLGAGAKQNRQRMARRCRSSRPPVDYLEAYLDPLVSSLGRQGTDLPGRVGAPRRAGRPRILGYGGVQDAAEVARADGSGKAQRAVQLSGAAGHHPGVGAADVGTQGQPQAAGRLHTVLLEDTACHGGIQGVCIEDSKLQLPRRAGAGEGSTGRCERRSGCSTASATEN